MACLQTSVVRLYAGMHLLRKCCPWCVIVFNRHHCAAQTSAMRTEISDGTCGSFSLHRSALPSLPHGVTALRLEDRVDEGVGGGVEGEI